MGTVHDATFSSSVLLVMMFFISFLFSSHSTHSLCAAANFLCVSAPSARSLSLSLRECKPWPRGAGRFYRRRTRTRALIVATHAPAFWLLGACYALFALVVAAIRSRACFAAELVRRTSWATRAVLLFSTTDSIAQFVCVCLILSPPLALSRRTGSCCACWRPCFGVRCARPRARGARASRGQQCVRLCAPRGEPMCNHGARFVAMQLPNTVRPPRPATRSASANSTRHGDTRRGTRRIPRPRSFSRAYVLVCVCIAVCAAVSHAQTAVRHSLRTGRRQQVLGAVDECRHDHW